MPVDPQIQVLLDKGAGVPATHTPPVAEARLLFAPSGLRCEIEAPLAALVADRPPEPLPPRHGMA